MPRTILSIVYGESRLKFTLSSRPSFARRSRFGHFCTSRIVPTDLRFTPGTRYVSPFDSMRYENGSAEVSGCVVWRPMTSENAPTRAGQRTYESLEVFEPRSSAPWCIGPSLYMWLDWFEPEPAFMKLNIPAMRSVDLWCVTVKGPANTAHASPFSSWQLQKKRESLAE